MENLQIFKSVQLYIKRTKRFTHLWSQHPPCQHSRIDILQLILTTLGTYLVLKRIWNPINFPGHRSNGQGHWVKCLGEGIRHALRCPCFIWCCNLFDNQLTWWRYSRNPSSVLNEMLVVYCINTGRSVGISLVSFV
jgi:hypothetical protein